MESKLLSEKLFKDKELDLKEVMLIVSIHTSDWNGDAHLSILAPPFEYIPPEARGLACSSPLWSKTEAFPNSVVTRKSSASKMSISKNKTYQLAVVNKSVSSHHNMDNKTDPLLVSYLTDFTGKNNLLKQSVKWHGQKKLLGLLICRNQTDQYSRWFF